MLPDKKRVRTTSTRRPSMMALVSMSRVVADELPRERTPTSRRMSTWRRAAMRLNT